MTSTPRTRMAEKRRKFARKTQRIKMLLLSLGIAASSLVFYAGFNFNNLPFNDSSLKQVESSQVDQNVNKSNFTENSERINIMLMGVDERKEDVGRSDTLMVASIDSKEDDVSLLTITRYNRVQIKRHG